MWNVPYSDIATKKLAKFEEAGGELKVEDNKIVGGLLGKSGNDPNHLIGVIRDKIKRLNGGGYAKFDTYGLYVYVSTTCLWDSYVQSVIDEVLRIESKLKYKTIYLDIGFEMCICDMDSKTYERKAIDRERTEQ